MPLTKAPNQSWLAVTRRAYQAFLESPAGRRVNLESDFLSLRRLFDLYDERERVQRELRQPGARWVVGSTGQQKVSPLYSVIASIDSRIRTLEAHFYMDPGVRTSQLGKAAGESRPNLEDLDNDSSSDDSTYPGDDLR